MSENKRVESNRKEGSDRRPRKKNEEDHTKKHPLEQEIGETYQRPTPENARGDSGSDRPKRG